MGCVERARKAASDLFNRGRFEREMDEELQGFLDLAAEERERSGATPAEARRTARASFGGVEACKESPRDLRVGAALDSVGRDVRFSLRLLRRNPSFAITAILTIALGTVPLAATAGLGTSAGNGAISSSHMIGGKLPGDRSILIKGGYVLSLDPAIGDLPDADVLIEGETITAVGPNLQAPPHANVLDGRSCVVMPGFVDTHRHTWQTPVRGVLPSCTLDQYFAGMLDNIGRQYRPEDVYIANLMGALEALNGGITTLLDWSHVNNTPEHADAAVAGLREAGIRAIYAHGVPVGGDWWAYSSREHPEDIRRIRREYFSSDDQLLTLALAARAPGNTTPDVAAHDWRLPATSVSVSAYTSACG